MLVKPPIEELLPHVENRYTLAIAVSKRVRQLVDGAEPYEPQENDSLITLACQELAKQDIFVVPADVKPYIPQRPELLLEPEPQIDPETGEEAEIRTAIPLMDFTQPALTEQEEEQHELKSFIRRMEDSDVFLMPEEEGEDTYHEDDDFVELEDEDDADEESSGTVREISFTADEEELETDLSGLDKISDSQLYRDEDEDEFDIDGYED